MNNWDIIAAAIGPLHLSKILRIPIADDTYDLGSSGYEWKDLYVDGVAYLDTANIDAIQAAGSITMKPSGDTSDYFTFATASDVPTIYGTGAYVRIGDAAATSCSLASEDDLLVSGKLEVDGYAYFDYPIQANWSVEVANGVRISPKDYDASVTYGLQARDVDGTAWRDMILFTNANDPTMALCPAGGFIGFFGATPIGRVVDERIDDAINSGDATTDGVIDAMRDALIAYGLMAAA